MLLTGVYFDKVYGVGISMGAGWVMLLNSLN